MNQDLLEQLNNAKLEAQSAGPNQQSARIRFYNSVWAEWDNIYAALKEQPAGQE